MDPRQVLQRASCEPRLRVIVISFLQVLAHFPPANTYSSSAGVEDILKSQKQSRDLGRCSDSLLLYGHGDGGGGPTRGTVLPCSLTLLNAFTSKL